MASKLHSITAIPFDELSAIDLRDERKPPGETILAYRALALRDDGTPEAQALDVLHCVDAGRIGIAWGSDARWADDQGQSVAELVELFLSDGEAYDARA